MFTLIVIVPYLTVCTLFTPTCGFISYTYFNPKLLSTSSGHNAAPTAPSPTNHLKTPIPALEQHPIYTPALN